MNLSSELLKLLVCPVTGGKLSYDPVKQALINKQAGLEYPIINGIPLLLESEAKKIK